MRTGAFLFSALSLIVGCSEVEVDPQGGGGSGAGGAGGGGGSGGSGYEPFPEACTPPALVGICDGEAGPKCGNGALDTCEICWSVDGSPEQCADRTEECDTTASQTCQALGYQGGETICNAGCAHDVRDCDSCLGSPNQLACARPRVDGFNALGLQLATNGDEIAGVWQAGDGALHFARFTKDLELIAEKPGCSALESGGPISFAPTPGGWMVAVGAGLDGQMQLIRLDAEGNQVGTPRLVQDATFPTLVARPGTTPYLVYARGPLVASASDVVAELLDQEGEPAWQVELPSAAFAELTVAGFASPGLLVSARETDGATSRTVLVPIDEQGTLGAPRDLGDVFEIEMVNAGPGLLAASWRRGESQELQWLDGDGADVGAPVTLAPRDTATAFQERALVVSEGRALVLLAEDTRKTLTAFHVEQDGTYAVTPYTFATEPLGTSLVAGTQVGADAVFAWTTYSSTPAGDRFVLGKAKR